jgi:hypothetical protein
MEEFDAMRCDVAEVLLLRLASGDAGRKGGREHE